jgi:hypothetical protein
MRSPCHTTWGSCVLVNRQVRHLCSQLGLDSLFTACQFIVDDAGESLLKTRDLGPELLCGDRSQERCFTCSALAKATWEWAHCIAVILLSMSQLIQQVLDEHIILGANMMSVIAITAWKERWPYTLPICPPTPPANATEGPTCPSRCIHKPILRTPSSKRVCCVEADIATIEVCTTCEGIDEFLCVLGRHGDADIDSVGCHQKLWEDGVVQNNRVAGLHIIFIPPFPVLEVVECIDGRVLRCWIEVVLVP